MLRRALTLLVLLTACAESHAVGEGDGGAGRDGATRDATSFDAIRFDVSPRFDASARRDAGPDAGEPDVGPFFDLLDACERLCERGLECGLAPSLDECVGGCLEIEIYAVSEECEALTQELFFCSEGRTCEELEFIFEDGECTDVVRELESRCGRDG